MLAHKRQVYFLPLGITRQERALPKDLIAKYKRDVESVGVTFLPNDIAIAFRDREYDLIIFEWHFPAIGLLDEIRFLSPRSKIIIDSVDVVFNRLDAKAKVSGLAEDILHAKHTREVELSTYRKADLVITVTDPDSEILREAIPETPTYTIPNIHPLHEPVDIDDCDGKRLLFIGSFAQPGGETNIDAMRYFCGSILPLISAEEPNVALRIVGGPRTPEIEALSCDKVQVVGFVPETHPYLATSTISVAPLRFGGGMKGKIGEAMSFGLPVVTTSTGIEGFGLKPGRHVLVGDTPQAFAEQVLLLLRDRAALDRIRMAGHEFIQSHFSADAVDARVQALLGDLGNLPAKRLPLATGIVLRTRRAWRRHVSWRVGAS
jgi:glycosyltransferase involved in cell wall biosynthesis